MLSCVAVYLVRKASRTCDASRVRSARPSASLRAGPLALAAGIEEKVEMRKGAPWRLSPMLWTRGQGKSKCEGRQVRLRREKVLAQ